MNVNNQTPPGRALEADIRQQEEALERLLSAADKKSGWQRRPDDPESQRVIGIILTYLSELRRVVVFGQDDQLPPRVAAALSELLRRGGSEFRSIKVAWEYAEALQRILLAVGDRYFIQTQVLGEWQNEHYETRYPYGSWSMYLDRRLLDHLAEQYGDGLAPPEGSAPHRLAVECLTFLSVRRNEVGRSLAANANIRALYLRRLTRILGALLLLTLAVVWLVGHDPKSVVTLNPFEVVRNIWAGRLTFLTQPGSFQFAVVAALAGAVGSALSGFYRLRDQVKGLTALRSFSGALYAQPFVGAVVGLVLFLILRSHVIGLTVLDDRGGAAGAVEAWAAYAVYGFVAGFSEPFFLGIVGRVVSAADKDDPDAQNQNGQGKNAGATRPGGGGVGRPALHSPPQSPPASPPRRLH